MPVSDSKTKDRFTVERCRTCVPQHGCGFYGFPELQQIAERRFYGRDFTIIQQGDPATNGYIVCSGWLQITHLTVDGRAIVELAGPGTVLGLAGLMTGDGYCTSAHTLDECEVLQVEREALVTFLLAHPTVAIRLLQTLSTQWQKSLRHLYDLASKVPTEKRLMRALREIAATCGDPSSGGIRIHVPLSVQTLADTVGCSRQWISKLLGDLEAKGLIRHKAGWIWVTRAGLKYRS